jgi:hypothetical protein
VESIGLLHQLGRALTKLKPEYRLALARDGYILVRCEAAVFNPET